MAKIVQSIQLKRGTAQRWLDVNPVLLQGEPGFEYDTGKLKIGDGFSSWKQLEYISGGNGVYNAPTAFDFPEVGKPDVIYKASDENALYQWRNDHYEKLGFSVQDLEELFEQNKYKILKAPENTLCKITDYEIRIMCPEGTNWDAQNKIGTISYIELRVYAPRQANGYKHNFTDSKQPLVDKDEFDRPYITLLIPVAEYIDSAWVYYGAESTTIHYIGEDGIIDWYSDDNLIKTESIRINLSNENCHSNNRPYFMGQIDIDTLVQKEDDIIILDGGTVFDILGK